MNLHSRVEVYTECLGWIIVESVDKSGYGILENPYSPMDNPLFTRSFDTIKLKAKESEMLEAYKNPAKCI
jgi:hypothetical protein